MFAFTHLCFAWLLGKGSEYFRKKKLGRWAWLFLLFGSILPDVDYLIDWTLGTEVHRTLTHSLPFPLLAFISVYLFFTFLSYRSIREQKRIIYSSAIAVGIFTHLLLDMLLAPGIPFLWPSLLHFSYKGVVFFDPARPSFLHGSAEVMRRILKLAIFDMALGTVWIFYLWFKRRVKF